MPKRKVDKLEEEIETPDNKKGKGNAGKENQLLANMMRGILRGKDVTSFKKTAIDLDFMERTKTWRTAWKSLIDEGFIEACDAGSSTFTSNHQLTQKGKDHASTDEYNEHIKDMTFQPSTNEEHHARIKKRLINIRGAEIFDLLLEHGSLSRNELSGILGVSDRTHKFSYALQQLKQKEYVESDGKKKFHLSDKSFLSPEDRLEFKPSDQKVITELVAATAKGKIAKQIGLKKQVKPTSVSSNHKKKIASPEAVPAKKETNASTAGSVVTSASAVVAGKCSKIETS